jgi:hypothetical protein
MHRARRGQLHFQSLSDASEQKSVNSLPQPGKFPIASLESRSAARLRLVRLMEGRKRIRFISNIRMREADENRMHFGKWQDCKDGTLFQMVYVPHVWLKPGEEVPICPDCGTGFKKTSEYPGMAGFVANCIDKPDPELVAQLTNTTQVYSRIKVR